MLTLATTALAAEQASHAEAASGPLAALGLNSSLFLLQLFNFAVVAAVIWFLLLKPLVKKMGQRQDLIDASLDKAKKIDDRLGQLEKETAKKMAAADRQAKEIIEEARNQAKTLAQAEREKNKEEIKNALGQARLRQEKERREMYSGLKKELAGLVILATEKIYRQKISGEEDKKLVEKILKEID